MRIFSSMHSNPSLDLRPDHLTLILDILRKHVPDREVRAFGSRVQGSAKTHSDLDIVLMGTEPMELLDMAKLQDAFSESALPMKIDVLDWQTISPEFRKLIEKKYVVLKAALR